MTCHAWLHPPYHGSGAHSHLHGAGRHVIDATSPLAIVAYARAVACLSQVQVHARQALSRACGASTCTAGTWQSYHSSRPTPVLTDELRPQREVQAETPVQLYKDTAGGNST